MHFSHGIRTVPAGSMRFVDFSKPDPAEERVERFMVAAQRAMAEGDYALAAQRLIYARDAEPRNVAVLRLMTLAFWQAGNLEAAARSVRDWARVDGERPAPHRFAARIYEDMGAIDLAEEAARRADRARSRRRRRLGAPGAPAPAAGGPRRRARRAGAGAAHDPIVEGLLDLALARQLAGDPGGELSACEEATQLDPRVEPGLVALRARAGAQRPRQRVHRGLRAGAGARRGRRGARAAGARPGAGPAGCCRPLS